MTAKVGAIAIGRNEGERLGACLRALVAHADHVVYVDSGSTDGSRDLARGLGVEVVELDLSIPFTAARARNEGFEALGAIMPDIEFVQFVDGDCELRSGWMPAALEAMQSDERLAAVCGRRRERFPKASRYNRLTDMEWDTPIGPAMSCGGDALFRAAALREVGGYDPSVIAGEEPELCFRLRARGWKIRRIDQEMTWHDAAMTSFWQWWKRSVRAGHAAAEGAWMHGRSPEHFNVRRVLRPLFWGFAFPLAALAMSWFLYGLSIGLALLIYGLQWLRIRQRARNQGRTGSASSLLAAYTLIGQFAMVIGIATFVLNRIRGRRTRIIEYKGAQPGAHANG